MYPEQLKSCESRLYEPLPIPIIGKCLQRKAAMALAEDGSPDAVRVLAQGVTRLEDEEILAIVIEALSQLRKPACIDSVCQVWATTRHQKFANLLVKQGWVASAPVEVRVLTALKTGQLRVVTGGGQEIVEPLLEAFKDRDSEIASRASQCAIALTNPDAQEMVCHLASEQNHKIAGQVAIQAKYAPRDPSQRALFYFLTEQWDEYESLDYERTLLQKIYELGNETLRKRIADKAKQAGRVEWVGVVAGGRKGQRLGAMTDAEWETTLAVLNSGQQWEEMWRLAQKAPAIWSKQLLEKLKQVAWLPTVDQERAGFERLKQLAQKCLEKIPPMATLMRCQATLSGHTGKVYKVTFSPDGRLLPCARLLGVGDTPLTHSSVEEMGVEGQ